MKLTRRRLAVLAVPALLIAPIAVQPARAFFGGIVFDPSSYVALGHIWSQDISNFQKLIETVNQLGKIYTNGYQLVQSAVYMQRSISSPMRSSWQPRALSQVDNITRSRYGETINWPRAVNGYGASAPDAWQTAVMPLRDTSNLYAGMDRATAANFQAQIASVEITDGGSVQCLETIAQQHSAMSYDLAALRNLGLTFKSDNAAFNSLIQQLNMSNGVGQQATMQALRQSQMQACLVQQQLATNKIQRDQEVQGINTAIHTQEVMNDRNNAWDGNTPWSVALP